jgi:hypothetical protein
MKTIICALIALASAVSGQAQPATAPTVLPPPLSVLDGEPPELDQLRLLRVQFQTKLHRKARSVPSKLGPAQRGQVVLPEWRRLFVLLAIVAGVVAFEDYITA